jgi:hypothetical protein
MLIQLYDARGIKFVPLPDSEIPVKRIDFEVYKTVKTLDTCIFDHGHKTRKGVFA